MEKMVGVLNEKDLNQEVEKWYQDLEGSLVYEKLQSLRNLRDKRIKVCKLSKMWWNEELLKQLKKTRTTRKGKKGEGINQEGRLRRWKTEKEKIRLIVRYKKKEYWKQFCEKNEEKYLWEVVKWAKDSC